MQFVDLHMPLTTRMQLAFSGADYKSHTFPGQLLGYRPQSSVLVTLPKKNPALQLAAHVDVRVGLQSAIVRFKSAVICAHDQPFAYLHLTYPESVTIEQQLRRSPRFDFTVSVIADMKGGKRVRGAFFDISLNGARVGFEHPIVGETDRFNLSGTVLVAGVEQPFSLVAQIKSTPAEAPFVYGVAFVDVSPQQLLLLQALCYELQANKAFGASAA